MGFGTTGDDDSTGNQHPEYKNAAREDAEYTWAGIRKLEDAGSGWGELYGFEEDVSGMKFPVFWHMLLLLTSESRLNLCTADEKVSVTATKQLAEHH